MDRGPDGAEDDDVEPALTDQRWQELRGALADASARFGRLITEHREPERRAVGTWTVAEAAAHTAIVSHLDAGMLTGSSGDPELDRRIPGTTLGDLADLNALALRRFPLDSAGAIADHLREGVALLLERSADLDPRAPATWLGGSRLTVGFLLAHLLNEVLLHGVDVAGPESDAWHVPSAEAALAFDHFFVGLLSAEEKGILFGPPGAAGRGGGRQVSVELRSSRTIPVVLTTDGSGGATVAPAGGPADARIDFEPAAFMLTVFRRTGVDSALASGRLVVSGRNPAVGVEYLRRTQTP
ncbi:hypothetical protein CKY47_06695 [Saccharothrix yanglingensis]|uniref:Mycothiol-dependent maleylpyruvate isomerase metal-binding domain-containing protein n=1 Tax=Saccharothrix yanglingensis TaxID=659496 RepID=A0ABU0WUZ2_9PSEU|nr:hypothetical protein [Saccharothrix yanglingensis]